MVFLVIALLLLDIRPYVKQSKWYGRMKRREDHQDTVNMSLHHQSKSHSRWLPGMLWDSQSAFSRLHPIEEKKKERGEERRKRRKRGREKERAKEKEIPEWAAFRVVLARARVLLWVTAGGICCQPDPSLLLCNEAHHIWGDTCWCQSHVLLRVRVWNALSNQWQKMP